MTTFSLKKSCPPIATNIGVACAIADADDKEMNTTETKKKTEDINSEKKRSINATLFIFESIKEAFNGKDNTKKIKDPTMPTNTST